MQLMDIFIPRGGLFILLADATVHFLVVLLSSSKRDVAAKCGNHLKIKKKLPQQRFVALPHFLRDIQSQMH